MLSVLGSDPYARGTGAISGTMCQYVPRLVDRQNHSLRQTRENRDFQTVRISQVEVTW